MKKNKVHNIARLKYIILLQLSSHLFMCLLIWCLCVMYAQALQINLIVNLLLRNFLSIKMVLSSKNSFKKPILVMIPLRNIKLMNFRLMIKIVSFLHFMMIKEKQCRQEIVIMAWIHLAILHLEKETRVLGSQNRFFKVKIKVGKFLVVKR